MVRTPPRFRSFLTRPAPLGEETRAERLALSWPPPRGGGSWVARRRPPATPGSAGLRRGPCGPAWSNARRWRISALGPALALPLVRSGPGRAAPPAIRALPSGRVAPSGARCAPAPPTGAGLGGGTPPVLLSNTPCWTGAPPSAPGPPPLGVPQGSGLNQGERWFALVSRNCLRRAPVGAPDDLRTVRQRVIPTWTTPCAPPGEGTYTGKPRALAPPPYELLAA